MMPYQPLLNHQHQAIACLTWVTALPPSQALAYPATVTQLLVIFYHLLAHFPLRAPPCATLAEFLAATQPPMGSAVVRPPLLFLPADRPDTFLRFDYPQYLRELVHV